MSKLKAINGNCFVKRYEKETSVGGIAISEGAQVDSMFGSIVEIGECSFAMAGDWVHIPHYGVIDVEVNGEKYAMFKQDRLFLVNDKCVNKYVQVRKCENDHVLDEKGDIAIYMTDKHIEFTYWVEVMDIADDCETMNDRYKGMFCVAPENDEKLARIGTSKDFCLHESLIKFLTEG